MTTAVCVNYRNSLLRATGNPVRLVACVLLSAVLSILPACSSNNDASTVVADQPELDWQICPDNVALDCAALEVPLDYTHPDADTLSIALAMHSANDASKGILLLNPGGPGGSGVEFLQQLIADQTLPERIVNQFDIIGFDPRGVAGTEPVVCGEAHSDMINSYPGSEQAVLELLASTQQQAADCMAKYGDRLLHFGSNNVVRDMESIREAMNASALNFLGYSYGTRLGSLYLQLFPQHAGKLILDASLPPTADIFSLMLNQTQGMQMVLTTWLSGCTQIEPGCDASVMESALVQRMEALSQMRESSDTLLADAAAMELEALGGIVMMALEESEFADIALPAVLAYLDSGDTRSLFDLISVVEELFGVDPAEGIDSDASFRAIACADDAARPGTGEYLEQLNTLNRASDLLAETVIGQTVTCHGWPAAIDPVMPVDTLATGQALVIGGTSDPATPLLWSERMAQALNIPLLVSEHSGHTIVFRGTSPCVDEQVIDFLLDDISPGRLSCGAQN